MRYARLLLGAVLLTALATGCGTSGDNQAAPGDTAGAPATSGVRKPTTSIPAVCLDEATISDLVGFAVAFEQTTLKSNAQAVNCTFPATDQTNHAGVNVAILVAPASYGQVAIDDITASAARAGVSTQPVDLGQGGLSYGSSQRSAAATVVGDKVVGITIGTTGPSSLGDKRAAAVAVLRQVVTKL